jgi:superfamily I DNA/RNA helicase
VFSDARRVVQTLGRKLPLNAAFLAEEADYVLGRYLPAELENYLTDRREGRGTRPRVDQALRGRILTEMIRPYTKYKADKGLVDWNDLALDLVNKLRTEPYDVVIVDEAQDFSANQVRAINNHLAADHTVTYILDAAQRIYPRFFTWKEIGLTIPANATFRLTQNHRNTKEIAAFAKQIIENLDLTDDGTMPDLRSCTRTGPQPQLLVGRFSQQMDYAVNYIRQYIDLRVDSVGFLHPLGGGWFRHVRERLSAERLPFTEIAREAEWPGGTENIALSTLHSAKGLEFDHVFMLGLNDEVLPQKDDDEDSAFETLQRLFAMAVGRAKTSLLLGYKTGEAPAIIKLVKKNTYELVTL